MRDPEKGGCVAVLELRAFSARKPISYQTWFLTVTPTASAWQRDGGNFLILLDLKGKIARFYREELTDGRTPDGRPARRRHDGENSFIRLSTDGGKTMTDRVSHWRVLWSPAGQGHALFIESAARRRRTVGLCRQFRRRALPATPHRDAALHAPFADESLPILDAEFSPRRQLAIDGGGAYRDRQGRDRAVAGGT